MCVLQADRRARFRHAEFLVFYGELDAKVAVSRDRIDLKVKCDSSSLSEASATQGSPLKTALTFTSPPK